MLESNQPNHRLTGESMQLARILGNNSMNLAPLDGYSPPTFQHHCLDALNTELQGYITYL